MMKILPYSLATVTIFAGSMACGSHGDKPSTDQELSGKPQKKPNILFCIADDASFMHFGANGCTWVRTPAFDRIAAEGINFVNGYTPNAKCAPSRAALLTGRNSWQLEEAGNHIGFWPANKYRTYPEALAMNGYFVGFTGKPWSPGDPGMIDGKERQLLGKAYQSKRTTPPTRLIGNTDYAGNFEDFLNDKPVDTPWCFWYGGTEPHRAYVYGSGIEVGGKTTDMIEKVPGFWPDNDTVRTDMLDYALEIEYFDLHIGRMLKLLEERGELENTIVVVTSDNGMPFPRSKGLQYEYSNHMPLAIMWPAGIKNPGRVETGYVSFIDLAPTFIEVAGFDFAKVGMEASPGRSLTDVFAGKPEKDRSYILLGQERHDYGRPQNQGYPIRSVLENGFLYMYNFKPDLWPAGNPETGYLNADGGATKTNILNLRRSGIDERYWKLSFGKHPQEELYQVSTDPECLVNLAGSEVHKATRERLKKKLFDELKAQQDPRVLGNGDVFDNYPFMQESSTDFYERYMNGQIIKYQTNWVSPGDYEKEVIK
jgi:arylsulfatase A-like enzyme